MKRSGFFALLLIPAFSLVFAASAAAETPKGHPVKAGPLATPELVAAIVAADRALFAAGFDTCDIAAFADLVAEDFEFYHDKHGQIANDRKEFVDAVRGTCERQAAGTDIKARRELVEGTMVVHAVADDGAIQLGSHRFFGLEPGKPEQLRETAQYFHLWKKVDGKWKLARVFSFDHRAAE